MKYLKDYNLFLEATSVADNTTLQNTKTRFDTYQKDINEYKTKRPNLEKLVLGNKDNKDIKNDVKRLIGTNKILSMYLPIINIKKSLNDLESKMEYDNTLLNERQKDLQLANTLSDPEDRSSQITKTNEKLKELRDRIKDNEVKLIEINKKLKEEENAFKLKLDKTKKDLQEKIKALEKGGLLKIKGIKPEDNQTSINKNEVDIVSKDFSR
jgi:hypothetical protein